jgi:hypothetical protein
MSDRPPPATPAAGSAPDDIALELLRAAGAGLVAALALTAGGLMIAVVEYVASGERYRPWTWIKVAILYALAFCGTGVHVSVRAGALLPDSPPLAAAFRLPMILGAVAFVALLVRAGGRIVDDGGSASRTVLAAGAVVAAATIPLFLASFAVSLRFPEVGDAVVTPIRWQAALFPPLVAAVATGAGAFGAWSGRVGDAGRTRPMVWVEGGWRMFITALALAFIGFLIVASVSPGWTARYARAARGAGRTGGVVVLHHLLLLPAQTMLSLAPAMGGEVHVGVEGETEGTISLRAIHPSRSIALLGDAAQGGAIDLGGAWYAFLLVPAVAAVAGGRRAGRSGRRPVGRAADGAAAGAAFALLVVVGCAFATTAVPFLGLGLVPVRISAPIGTTAALALGWGVVGGALGAVGGGGARSDQTPVPEPGPGPGEGGPETLTSL